MRLSYWDINELEESCDVAVIGAGIVGLSGAINIAKLHPSLSVVVLEKEIYGTLASSRNAGFACFGSVSEIFADIDRYGLDQTLALVRKRRSGIKKLVDRYSSQALGYKGLGGFEVFEDAEKFNHEAARIKEVNTWLGGEVFKASELHPGMSFYKDAIFNIEEGQLDTGKLYTSLEREALIHDIKIVRGANVKSIHGENINFEVAGYTDLLTKKADKILVCTNALSADLYADEDIIPVRNQVIVTSPMPNLAWEGTYHQDKGFIYFRNIGKRILIGGARHKHPEEHTGLLGPNPVNQTFLVEFIKNHLVDQGTAVSITNSWSGILSGGDSRMPVVKRINERTVIAARLSGMGVAIGMTIGEEAATLLLD